MTDSDVGGLQTSSAPVLIDIAENTGVTTGIITLNREKALNSLNREMVDIITEALNSWNVDQVLIESASPKGFCAGGDVRAARESILDGNAAEVNDFFDAEYAMNELLAGYEQPIVSLIDGVAMGGGLGISAHGSHRVITEKAFASMPEMAIGFITDVGMSHVFQTMVGSLGRPSRALGLFLAATGWRLNPTEMIYTGLATHFVASDSLPALREAILTDGIEWALKAHAAEPSATNRLEELVADIETVFDHRTWSEISEALARSGNADLQMQVRSLTLKANPASLVAVAQLFDANDGADLHHCLANENRLGVMLRRESNFAEGVRAVLVDKTRDATFRPQSVGGVDPKFYRRALTWYRN